MYTYPTSHRIHSKYRRHIQWIPSTPKVDVIMFLRLPIIIIKKINPTFQRHTLSPASEKNMIIKRPLVTLTHFSSSHTHKSRPNLQEQQQPVENTRQSRA